MRHFSEIDILTLLLTSARWTVVLSLIAFFGGSVVGAGLTVARVSGAAWASRLVAGICAGVQVIPLLMLIFLTFFGLPLLGIEVNAWTAAIVSLVVFTAAFLCEIWTTAIASVPQGQWEAARALGLTRLQMLRLVVAPQAVRVAIAPTVGFSVQTVKGTALASIIGFIEVTKAGTMLNNVTFRPFFVFSCVALIYFALCFPLSLASRVLERRLSSSRN